MSEEGFFRRWARLKEQGAAAPARPAAPPAVLADSPPPSGLPAFAQGARHPPAPPATAPAGAARPLPTLDDVALLTSDSDFSAFVTQGVDRTVQRLAMKKLFSDPHFHVMDGLDTYIDDYTKSDPVPPAMLASLQHAKNMFARLMDEEEDGKPATAASRNDERNPEPPAQGDA